MIRILHVMGCSDAGGISSVVRNYYQFIDRTRIHFDIALTVPTAGQNARALEEMGAKIYFIPMKSQDRKGFHRELTRLLTEGKYDGIHVHESETCYVALRLAKKLGIPCRIAHAHITSPYEGVASVLRRWSGCLLNYPYASHVIGCGQLAGERIFGKRNMKRERALVLPNAVDLERFTFDPAVREETRAELGVRDRYVLGMVARLSEQKNIPYAVELMAKLRQREPNAVLLIAGNGEDEELIREKIRSLHVEDTVKLLGRRADVERLYQAFDLFLLPSLYEGYPVAAVEALSTGLPALLSDQITRELECFSGVTYLSLKDQNAWLDQICRYRQDPERMSRQGEPKRLGMDIRSCAGILQKVYEEDTAKRAAAV